MAFYFLRRQSNDLISAIVVDESDGGYVNVCPMDGG